AIFSLASISIFLISAFPLFFKSLIILVFFLILLIYIYIYIYIHKKKFIHKIKLYYTNFSICVSIYHHVNMIYYFI
ncbi:MAG: hypothetical protein N7Q72_05830, partial [Spiroplasma sp. Tabriz.8]|nr:hypothetical protein [Spiroplasma sp. Tabriz.8]